MLRSSPCRDTPHRELRFIYGIPQADASAAKDCVSDALPDKQSLEPDQQHSQHAMACQEKRGNLSGPSSPEHTDKEAVIAEAFAVCDADSLTMSLLMSIKRQVLVRSDICQGELDN